ncbi:MAG TPA: zinc ribbon domain-containing protein [Planctomycetota bacterium]|nr:zinc ribbon domain-containing protein [Planctomycetota bacterium]
MPTYDYLCAACGHTFERFESIGDDKPKACEKCGKKKARRRMGTGAGLIFKGSGFYTTDYKNAGSSKPRSSEPGASEKKDDKKDAKKKDGKEPTK